MNEFNGLLSKTLIKFKKKDYPKIVRLWNPYHGSSLAMESEAYFARITKAVVVRRTIQICKTKKTSIGEVYDLDLLHTKLYSYSKQWTVFQLSTNQSKKDKESWTAIKLKESLKKEIQLTHSNVSVAVVRSDDLFWIRISYSLPRRHAPTNVIYLALAIGTVKSYIMCGYLKKRLESILQAFLEVLDCSSSIEELPLKGRSIKSLLQMVKYKECQLKGMPWQDVKSQKRKANELEEDIANVVSENKFEKRRRLDAVHKTFGSGQLPMLEKVEYKLETHFRGTKFAPKMAEKPGLFNCSVKFEGPSVINGIRNLAAHGLISMPLKQHLRQVHLKGRNTFLLRARELNTSNSGRNMTLEESMR